MTAPASVPVTVPVGDELAGLMLEWAEAADAVDDVEMIAVLAAGAGATGAPAVSLRAGSAYLAGDAAAALRILAETGAHVVPPDGARSLDHVLALGARACLGDMAAFSALVAVGPHVPLALRVRYLYVLAVAAEGVGQAPMADDAWRSIVLEHGIRTPLAVSRAVAGLVTARDRATASAALEDVFLGAAVLRDMSPRPTVDAEATGWAADRLRARHDDAGAALLVAAVRRTSARSAGLEALASRVRPSTSVTARALPWGLSVLGVAVGIATGIGMIAVVPAIVAATLVRRYVRRVPGMTRIDSEAWAAIDRLRFDEKRNQTGSGATEVRLWPTLGLLVGIAVGVVVGARLADLTAEADLASGARSALWFVPIVGGAFAGAWAGMRLTRLRDARQVLRREAAEDAALIASAEVCRCWSTAAIVGPFATAYAAGHLGAGQRAPLTGVVPPGRTGALLQCPVSGARWLATTSSSRVSDLLLRAAARPIADPPAADAVGMGGYL